MAKAKVLTPVNKATWNSKVEPNNKENIIKEMKSKLSIEDITAIVSIKDNIIDAYVLTPSNILYQFTVDSTTDDFDIDWWAFALRNYYVVFANSFDKGWMSDLAQVELKDVTGKVLQKGKSSGTLSQLSLDELLSLLND